MKFSLNEGIGPCKIKWDQTIHVPSTAEQLFLPLYLNDEAVLKLRGSGIWMGGISRVSGDFYIRRAMGAHLLLLTCEGTGRFHAGGEEIETAPGSFVIAPGGLRHSYYPRQGKPWTFLWFHLLRGNDWCEPRRGLLYSGHSTDVVRGLRGCMERFVEEMYPLRHLLPPNEVPPKYYENGSEQDKAMCQFGLSGAVLHPDSGRMAGIHAEAILAYIGRLWREFRTVTGEGDEIPQRLRILWDQVGNAPEGNWSLEHMAKTCSMSVSSFQRQVRKFYDTSPGTILMHVRMRHAAILLRETNQSLLRIAIQSGYSGLSSFCAAFQKHYRCNPKEFRIHSRQPVLPPMQENDGHPTVSGS